MRSANRAFPRRTSGFTSWLEAHHLRGGLSGYWQSNVITLTSGDRVQVGLVSPRHGRLVPGGLETNATWCDQHRCSANFVVLSLDYPGYIGFTDAKVVLATFGKPARTYHVGADTVLVWNKILLAGLH